MQYFVYILISQKTNRPTTYVGYTNNLKRRIKLHNEAKGAKFTRGRKWSLLYSRKYANKNIAMSEEYKLKKNYKLRKKIKSRVKN